MWAWVTMAMAGQTLLLHSDDERVISVVTRVSAETGRDASELRPFAISAWIATLPPRFEGGELRVCEAERRDAAWFEARLAEANKATLYFDEDQILAATDAIAAALPCASEVLPRELASRALLLRGFVQHKNGDAQGASTSFSHARSMNALLRYDPKLPAGAREAFEAASPSTETHWVEVRPTPSAVWVDGERVTYTDQGVQIPAGRHVITAVASNVASADVEVSSSGALILPSIVGGAVIEELDNPRNRSTLLQMLNYARVQKAYLSDIEHVWKAEGNRMSQLGVEPEPIFEPRRRGRFTPVGLVIGGVGLATAGVGAALLAGDAEPVAPIALLAGGGVATLAGAGIVIGDQIRVAPTFGIRGRW